MTNKAIELGADILQIDNLFCGIDLDYYRGLMHLSGHIKELAEVLRIEKGIFYLHVSTSGDMAVETMLKLDGASESIEFNIRGPVDCRSIVRIHQEHPDRSTYTTCNFRPAVNVLEEIAKFLKKYPKFNIIDFINSIK